MENNFPFESPEQIFNERDFLWKYVDIHKLLYFIQEQKLYFNRLDSFEDPYEGIGFTNIALRHFISDTLSSVNKEESENYEKLIREAEELRKRGEIDSEIAQKCQFVNCWFYGHAESIAMWNLYSNRDSVALKFNARLLAHLFSASVKKYDPSLKSIAGKVVYSNLYNPTRFLGLNDEKFHHFFALNKDISYSHENEFRFIIQVEHDNMGKVQFIEIPILNFCELDFEIVAHPQMEQWKFKNIENLFNHYNIQNKLKRSFIKYR
jgi:hypothetical protein